MPRHPPPHSRPARRSGAVLSTLAFVLAGAIPAIAQTAPALRLPAIFGDGMVLQRDAFCPVWGWAAPGAKVGIRMGAATAAATAGDDGRWRCDLKVGPASFQPARLSVTAGVESVTVDGVLAGEVWIASGQSNMWWALDWTEGGKEEAASADAPAVRMFTVVQKTSDIPLDDCAGAWQAASAGTVSTWSAVGWYFGKELHRALGVPIGLVHTSWGGTPAEAWARREAIDAHPDAEPILARAAAPKTPAQIRACHLWNAMVAPLVPYRIRGAIWYQGESNVVRAWQYRTLFPAMIADWRAAFGHGDFPFGFVQLAPFSYTEARSKTGFACAELREAQEHTLRTVPNTGMAVTMDIGNPKDIHPGNKRDVGGRLARWALARVYGQDTPWSGPIFKACAIDGDRAVISFDHAGGGLKTRDGAPPTCFRIAGEDRNFTDAQAEIRGSSVVVRAEGISAPVAVRFAYWDDAEPNLENSAGLPAAPFRSDDWPAHTRDVH